MFDGDEVIANFGFAQLLHHYWRLPSMNHPPVIHDEIGEPGAGIAARHAIFNGTDNKTCERRKCTDTIHTAEHIPIVVKAYDGHGSKAKCVKEMTCCEETQ